MPTTIVKEENPVFITDPKGKKLGVVLSIKEYRHMLGLLENAHDIAVADKRITELALDQEELDRELKKHGVL